VPSNIIIASLNGGIRYIHPTESCTRCLVTVVRKAWELAGFGVDDTQDLDLNQRIELMHGSTSSRETGWIWSVPGLKLDWRAASYIDSIAVQSVYCGGPGGQTTGADSLAANEVIDRIEVWHGKAISKITFFARAPTTAVGVHYIDCRSKSVFYPPIKQPLRTFQAPENGRIYAMKFIEGSVVLNGATYCVVTGMEVKYGSVRNVVNPAELA
jgi:hypothetical protein